MHKFSGAVWVDAGDRQVARLEAQLIDSFKLGGGLLASIKPGGGLVMEQDRINNEIWLPVAGVEYLERRGGMHMETLWKDLRFGARMLRKKPGFTFIALLTLALGIGANTAIFSVIHAVLLHPLPFAEQERLIVAWKKDTVAYNPLVEMAFAEFKDWQAQSQSFDGMLDPTQVATAAVTMEEQVTANLARPRFNALLLNWLSGLAVLLAAVGIYGVVAYAVAQRTGELGIRLALGAQAKDILKLIIGENLKIIAAGVGCGLAGALALTRLMRKLLFGVSPTDPLTFVVIALLLTVVALLACYLPARRATKVDPLIALRSE